MNGNDILMDASLAYLKPYVSRSVSPENPTGEKGRGAQALEGTGAMCAEGLGRGWKVSPSYTISPGEVCTLADIQGPGIIQSIWMTGYVGREFILRLYWDDQINPSVECPMPDFFASGWCDNSAGMHADGFQTLNSALVCVNPSRALCCFFPMPFRGRARVTLENRSESKEHTVYYQINYALTEIPERAAYFHAQFRTALPLKAGQDFTIVDGITGRGHYIGTALSVGLNGAGGWWGEGEIKFFMDGDIDPTICYTGTEDYFLGAYNWDVNHCYQTYHSLYGGMHAVYKPDGLYKSQQRFSMYRWHVVDPVCFDNDLRVTIQDIGWRDGGRYLIRRDDFASVAYWYQTLPSAPFAPLPDRETLEYFL